MGNNPISNVDPFGLVVKVNPAVKVFQHRDVWDAGVGAIGIGAAFMLSNPVGWGIGIGVLIYGGATLIYDAVKD